TFEQRMCMATEACLSHLFWLMPVVLALPWVAGQRHAAASIGPKLPPVHWMPKGVQRPQRCQHRCSLFFLPTQGGQRSALPPSLLQTLRDRTREDWVGTQFHKDIATSFAQPIHRLRKADALPDVLPPVAVVALPVFHRLAGYCRNHWQDGRLDIETI